MLTKMKGLVAVATEGETQALSTLFDLNLLSKVSRSDNMIQY